MPIENAFCQFANFSLFSGKLLNLDAGTDDYNNRPIEATA
jgi:hypothetical protein